MRKKVPSTGHPHIWSLCAESDKTRDEDPEEYEYAVSAGMEPPASALGPLSQEVLGPQSPAAVVEDAEETTASPVAVASRKQQQLLDEVAALRAENRALRASEEVRQALMRAELQAVEAEAREMEELSDQLQSALTSERVLSQQNHAHAKQFRAQAENYKRQLVAKTVRALQRGAAARDGVARPRHA
jgi:hypothetical protein